MRTRVQEEFEEALEFYVDDVDKDTSRLKRASQLLLGDDTAIENPFCGQWIARLEGQTLPIVDLTYSGAAKSVLSHPRKLQS